MTKAMIAEIIKELTTIKDTIDITSNWVLSWIKYIEAQWSEKAMLDSMKDIKEFDMKGKIKCETESEHVM